jgi:hypothetical protein
MERERKGKQRRRENIEFRNEILGKKEREKQN